MPSQQGILDLYCRLEFPFVVLKVFPADYVLLDDRLERLAHGRLAEAIRCTDELKNQAQEPFHLGTYPRFTYQEASIWLKGTASLIAVRTASGPCRCSNSNSHLPSGRTKSFARG